MVSSCVGGDTRPLGWCARQQPAAYEQRLLILTAKNGRLAINQMESSMNFLPWLCGAICGQHIHNRWCVLVGVCAFSWLRKEQSNLRTNPFNVSLFCTARASARQFKRGSTPPNEWLYGEVGAELYWNYAYCGPIIIQMKVLILWLMKDHSTVRLFNLDRYNYGWWCMWQNKNTTLLCVCHTSVSLIVARPSVL